MHFDDTLYQGKADAGTLEVLAQSFKRDIIYRDG